MPDWTYRPLLRPVFFWMGLERARRLAIGTLQQLGKSSAGLATIDFLGHLRANPKLQVSAAGRELPGPVGLGSLIDPAGLAATSLSRFGAGFIEIGPVGIASEGEILLAEADPRSRRVSGLFPRSIPVSEVQRRLGNGRALVPIWVRIAAIPPADCREVATALASWAGAFLISAEPRENVDLIAARLAAVRQVSEVPLILLSIGADAEITPEISSLAGPGMADGLFIRGELTGSDGSLILGAPCRDAVLANVRRARQQLPADALVVAGGVLDPDDVRRNEAAGANLSAVDAGLILSGPGLMKRCNEALLLTRFPPEGKPESFSLAAARHAWFWALMLGIAMLSGGFLALWIASTRVVLPYDEALCGMTRAQLAVLNPQILPFMAHDRVSLAGVMLSLGAFYAALAWNGIRRGSHWAQVTVVISATSGFFSFFLFLGFGYFDPFHAFVTAILFPMLLLCLFAPLPPPRPLARPEWMETRAWRRGQWGQLLFVTMGVSLLAAGTALSVIGCSKVFVQDDLDFLGTTAAQLFLSSERLIPLIAHDRATLGGMLVASGLAIWLAAQWGFRKGEAWLWHTLKWAGLCAFAVAITVHIAVHYLSWLHLLPPIAGMILWLLALWLTKGWLLDREGGNNPAADLVPHASDRPVQD